MQLQSSPAIEMIVRNSLIAAVARTIETAGFHGTAPATSPPVSLPQAVSAAVDGGTNGANPDLADIVDLETEVAQDNADIGNLCYVTNAKVRGILKQTEKFGDSNGRAIWEGNEMNGYRALCTNTVSSALTKGSTSGTCSAIFFGNWADLLIGMWGVPDVLVDPYTAGNAGTLRVSILQDIDIAVRHAVSFAAMLDATTA
jgi:HK97 family phage major capsid protein